MSTSIRICSYLLLPLIYLLVNVKIAQLGESFPITIVTFLPVLLLLFLERISVKKLMIALGIGAGLTAFNYLFGQSLDASKYVTSTMLFVYIVIIIGMVWSIRFKTISPHNHRKILRFFYLVREVYRPWGKYDSIDAGDRYQVKRITVKPGEGLSVQMHHHRAEHWVVVAGTAKVTIDGDIKLLGENESIYIPLGAMHCLENPGKIPLDLIEVRSGSYLEEDDVVRFADRYGRV